MKYLLDTHAFVWLNGDPTKLSMQASSLCKDPSNLLMLSLASIWEMQIKVGLGKLKLPASLVDIIEAQQRTNAIQLLAIELSHVLELDLLPVHHRDPFDRLLIAQARVEGLQLISNDPEIAKYPVSVIW